jgi:ABC-type histidine transport system ATPase subunit
MFFFVESDLCYRERKYPRIYVLKNDCKDQIDSVHSTRDHVSIAGICISISTGEGVSVKGYDGHGASREVRDINTLAKRIISEIQGTVGQLNSKIKEKPLGPLN